MKKLRELIVKYWWICIILLCLPAIRSYFVPGFWGVSDDMHVAWLYEMDQAIKMGQLPPRFVPDLSFGFGYPLFNFVFPLPFYLGELFHLIGFNLVDSIKVVFLLSVPLSALTMYLFLRQTMGGFLSITGALLYVYTPYRALDLFVRGAIGESLAFVFFPLVTLAILKLTSGTNSPRIDKWLVVGGISLAGLILSHNIATYMFIPFAVVLGVVRIWFQKLGKREALWLGLMFLFGLLISSFFWLPALVESNLMQYDTVFNFIDHFPTLKQLIFPFWGYGASVPGPYDGMSFNLGVVNIGVIVGGMILLVVRWKGFSLEQKSLMVWAIISFSAVVFMMNFRSTILWQQLPLLGYFQFPWRFLMMAVFLTPLFLIPLEKLRFSLALAWGLIELMIWLNISYFRPHQFLGRLDNYYLDRYIPVPTASSEYLTLKEEYLRLPKETLKRPDKNYPLVEAGGMVAEVTRLNNLNSVIKTFSDKEGKINYNKYFFPGWKAWVDGVEVPLWSGQPFGQMVIPVPAGQHQVEIKFEETSFRKVMNFLSLGGMLLALLILWKPKNLVKR